MLICLTESDHAWIDRTIDEAYRDIQATPSDSDSPLTVEAILAYWKWLDGEREREREKENGNA